MSAAHDEILALKERMSKEIIGQGKILECILIGMLSNGNLLVEGLPGLAKTRAIKALSNNVEGDFNRIQFTPDIVSGDITGRELYYKAEGDQSGVGQFKFVKGPIFANIVLADEVNRAPPRSQTALLEAMEERQVTISAVSHKVPDLFMVMATMNPAGQEGTFPMPEAQMDRFIMHVSVDYPTEQAEAEVIRLIRSEQSQKMRQKGMKGEKVERVRTSQETIFAARAEIDTITVPPDVEEYMVDLIFATRYPQRYTYELRSFIAVGASPRGSLALDRVSRADAWLKGQKEVSLDNVRGMLKSVLRHRIKRGERAVEHKITPDDVVEEILELVPTPEQKREKAAKGKPKTSRASI